MEELPPQFTEECKIHQSQISDSMAFVAFWLTHFLPLNPRNLLRAPSTTPYKIPLMSEHLFTNLHQDIHKGGVEDRYRFEERV